MLKFNHMTTETIEKSPELKSNFLKTESNQKKTTSSFTKERDLSIIAQRELSETRRLLEVAYTKLKPKEYPEQPGHRYEKILIENLRQQTKLPIFEPTKKEDQFGHIDLFIVIGEKSYALDFYTGVRERPFEKAQREKRQLPRILIHIPAPDIEEAIKHSKSKIPGTEIPILPRFIIEKIAKQIADFIKKQEPQSSYTLRQRFEKHSVAPT